MKAGFVSMVSLVTLTLAGNAVRAAEPTRLRPAALTEEPKSLQHQIQFPVGETDGLVRLNCDAWVRAGGGFRIGTCFAPDSRFTRYERAVASAIKRAVISPAVVDGVKQDVWFQYRVEFEKRGSSERIRVYPNQALQISTFGPAYSAPQRVLKPVEKLLDRDRCESKASLTVLATVTEQGKLEGVAVDPRGVGSASCRARLLERIQDEQFVPAFVDGQPIRALYRETFFYMAAARRI